MQPEKRLTRSPTPEAGQRQLIAINATSRLTSVSCFAPKPAHKTSQWKTSGGFLVASGGSLSHWQSLTLVGLSASLVLLAARFLSSFLTHHNRGNNNNIRKYAPHHQGKRRSLCLDLFSSSSPTLWIPPITLPSICGRKSPSAGALGRLPADGLFLLAQRTGVPLVAAAKHLLPLLLPLFHHWSGQAIGRPHRTTMLWPRV